MLLICNYLVIATKEHKKKCFLNPYAILFFSLVNLITNFHSLLKGHKSKEISEFCHRYNFKVEAPIVDQLRDLGADGEEFEVVEIFPM